MSALKKLLEPGRIGSLELKNRLLYSAMDLRSTDGHGHISDEAAASLVERARHGAGMVSLPGVYAWQQEGTPHGKTISLQSDDFIPQFVPIVKKVHELGARIMVQIGARGTRIEGSNTASGPSPVRFGYTPIVPHEMTANEIRERVSLLGDAIRRAREAGIDAVEIHACTGKLVSMFLSPYSNRRTDEYGGSTENRTRFLREIIADARAKAGDDYPLSVRLTVDDMLPGGIDLAEGLRIVKLVAPLVDAVQPSTGTQERIWNISCSYFFPPAYMLSTTEAVKKVSSAPVIAMAKLGEPLTAEKALAEGKADFISLGRPLLTDPRWLEKAEAGDYASIRRCIGCLNCFTFNDRKEIQPPRVSCTVNPELLREAEYDVPAKASVSRRVAVVGGGLAGMECARVLALRGHGVDLYEQDQALGGQWIVAAHGPHKHEEKTLIPWLEREIRRLGVRVHTGVKVTADMLKAEAFDEIVLATGARPAVLPLPVPAPGPNLVQGNDVIMDRAEVGHRAVIIGGRYVGMECAVKLAEQGHHVSVVDALEIGHGTNPRILGLYRNRMVENDVHLFPNSPVLRFMDYGVDIAHLNSMLSLKADTIVLAVGTRPVNELGPELDALGLNYHLIGDCKRIGDALYAMRDGADAAFGV